MNEYQLIPADDILPVMGKISVEAVEAGAKKSGCSVCEPDGCPLAMAYVPVQIFRKLYSAEKALERGTLFEELDFPFLPNSGKDGGKK